MWNQQGKKDILGLKSFKDFVVEVLGKVGVSKGYETENITLLRGTSKSYKLAKLKRDFGKEEV